QAASNGLRHLLEGQHPAKGGGGGEDEQDGRGGGDGRAQSPPHLGPTGLAIGDDADDRIDHRNPGRLGGGEYAAADPENDQDRQHDRRQRAQKGPAQRGIARLSTARRVPFVQAGGDIGLHQHHQRQQEAG